jgi:lipid-A-disaccharide synthase
MKIFISAGDYSGDLHASRLMAKLKSLYPDIIFEGIGGDMMTEQGLDSIVPLSEISVVGFWEVAKKYPKFKALLNRSKEMIEKNGYDLVLTVDYPGFNLRLAKYAKSIGLKTCQYIAPQAWAWGKDRAKEFSGYIDLLLVVFPFEVEFFNNFKVEAKFVGHPLMDDPVFNPLPKEVEDRDEIIAFLPGSRLQEIKRHGKLFQNIVDELNDIIDLSDYKLIVATTKNIDKETYTKYFDPSVFDFEPDSRELMKKARVGIVKTGTSTLEAALCGMPFVMTYKTSTLTYQYGKYVVNLPYLSLVNILENSKIVKEFIQKEATGYSIAREIERLLSNEKAYVSMFEKFLKIRNDLGGEGASEKASECISELLESKSNL